MQVVPIINISVVLFAASKVSVLYNHYHVLNDIKHEFWGKRPTVSDAQSLGCKIYIVKLNFLINLFLIVTKDWLRSHNVALHIIKCVFDPR